MGKTFLFLICIFPLKLYSAIDHARIKNPISNSILNSPFRKPLFFSQNSILLPDSPSSSPPPTEQSKSLFEEDLKRLKNRRKKPEEEPKSISERQENFFKEKLVEQAKMEHPMCFQLGFHLILPYASTQSDDLKLYSLDPSVKLDFNFRITEIDAKKPFLTAGFRGLNINGVGSYKQRNASINYFYFGPMIGIGQFYRAIITESENAEKTNEKKSEEILRYGSILYGYQFQAGIAMLHRLAHHDPGTNPEGDASSSKTVQMDGSGLWLEASGFYMFFNAQSVHISVGLQLAKEKTFYYFGLGTAGWY